MQPQIQADCQRELTQKRNNPGRIGLAARVCRSVELTNASATLHSDPTKGGVLKIDYQNMRQ
jgi:hypothetical protein